MPKSTIHFLMGKGGVGRSSMAIMMGRYFAQRSESCILVECNGATDIPEQFNVISTGYIPTQLTANIDAISISPMAAIEEYALQQLKVRKLYSMIFENRLVTPLIEAAPGLHDAVQLGKIYDLWKQQHWAHIIVDCPATGHGLSLLRGARTLMDMSLSGPLYAQNQLVDSTIREHGRIVLVTLPEELPMKETISLWSQLSPESQQNVDGVLINQWLTLPPLLNNLSSNSSDWVQLQNLLPAYTDRLQTWHQTLQNQSQWKQWLHTSLLDQHDFDIQSETIPHNRTLEWTKPTEPLWCLK